MVHLRNGVWWEPGISMSALYNSALILPQNWYISCSSARKCRLIDVFYSESFWSKTLILTLKDHPFKEKILFLKFKEKYFIFKIKQYVKVLGMSRFLLLLLNPTILHCRCFPWAVCMSLTRQKWPAIQFRQHKVWAWHRDLNLDSRYPCWTSQE